MIASIWKNVPNHQPGRCLKIYGRLISFLAWASKVSFRTQKKHHTLPIASGWRPILSVLYPSRFHFLKFHLNQQWWGKNNKVINHPWLGIVNIAPSYSWWIRFMNAPPLGHAQGILILGVNVQAERPLVINDALPMDEGRLGRLGRAMLANSRAHL